MKAQLFCLALVIVLLCPFASAQWVQTNGPHNGVVRCLAVTPAGSGTGSNVIAGLYGGGVFLSTNNGTTWTSARAGLGNMSVNCLVVSGTNLFAGASFDGLFRSTNSGATWEAIGRPDTIISHLAVSPNGMGGTNLYAVASENGTVHSLFLSTNNGTTWARTCSINSNVTSLAVVPASSGTGTNLLAGTDTSGIFLSANNGASWTAVNEGLQKGIKAWDSTRYYSIRWFELIGQNLFAGNNSGGIFLSTNGGTSWRAINDGLPKYTHSYDSHLYIPASCLASSGQNLFAAIQGVGLYVSTNNGANWKPLSNTGLTNAEIGCLAVAADGSGGARLIAGTDVGVFISTDNGASWASTGFKMSDVLALAASPTNGMAGINLFAGTPNGVFLSTNNGTSWRAVNTGLDLLYVNSFAIALNGAGETNIFVSMEGWEMWDGVYLSTNSGSNWSALSPRVPGRGIGNTVTALAVSLTGESGTNLFVGSYGNVFVSTDNGTSWTAVNTGSEVPINCFAVSSNGAAETIVYAGTDSGILRCTKTGTKWTAANTSLTTVSVHSLVAAGNNLLAGADSGVFLSTNNGASWNAVGSPNAPVVTFAVSSASAGSGRNIFAGTSAGVFLSTNNGTSWTTVNMGLTNTDVRALLVSGTSLYAATCGAGVWMRPLSEMITAVEERHNQVPSSFALSQNYPNPFNPSTTITYELPQSSHVSLSVYNMLGMEVSTLVNDERPAGVHTVQFNGSGLASGVYFYRILAGGFSETRKLVLMK